MQCPQHPTSGLLPIGVFISTPTGGFTSANLLYAEMLGYGSPQELIDTITDIRTQVYTDLADRDNFSKKIEADGAAFNHECRFRRRNGSRFWGVSAVQAITDVNGQITHYLGFITDISKRVRAEEALLETQSIARLGWWELDMPSGRLALSSGMYDFYEVSREVLAN